MYLCFLFSTIFIKSYMKIVCFDVSYFIALFIYTLQLKLRVKILLKLTALKFEQPTSISRHQLQSFLQSVLSYLYCWSYKIRNSYTINATSLLVWSHRYKNSTFVIMYWSIVAKRLFRKWQCILSLLLYVYIFFSFPYYRHISFFYYLSWEHGDHLIKSHPSFLLVRTVLFIFRAVFLVLLVFCLCSIPNVACDSGLPILDCLYGFL